MSLQVLKPGLLTLVQDYGRYGYQHIGVSQGGPLDEQAFLWGNRLLDNHYNAPQLEVSVGGFAALFTEPTMMAICGGHLAATLNGRALSPWQSYRVNGGDTLEFKTPRKGLRAYLAIKGGFRLAPQLGSCSTVPREKLGGLAGAGQALQRGDTLPYQPCAGGITRRVPDDFRGQYPQELVLRVLLNPLLAAPGGPVAQHFLETFLETTYQLSQAIDRMGYRLLGEPLDLGVSTMLSQGVCCGAIQVPPDGQPIVLMRDRQTMGGYPLVGCVAQLDLPLLAQSAPDTPVRFVAADIEAMEAELRAYKCFFNLPF